MKLAGTRARILVISEKDDVGIDLGHDLCAPFIFLYHNCS